MSFLKLNLPGEYGFIRGSNADRVQLFSVIDFIFKACEQDDPGLFKSKKILCRLRKVGGKYAEEMSRLIRLCKVNGTEEIESPCMTVHSLSILMERLGDRVSTEFRKETLKIFESYLEGDNTMIEEEIIEEKSNDMNIEEDLEVIERRLKLDERKVRLNEMRVSIDERLLIMVSQAIKLIDDMNAKKNMDLQSKTYFENYIKNVILS